MKKYLQTYHERFNCYKCNYHRKQLPWYHMIKRFKGILMIWAVNGDNITRKTQFKILWDNTFPRLWVSKKYWERRFWMYIWHINGRHTVLH